jgi:hypothetical protein
MGAAEQDRAPLAPVTPGSFLLPNRIKREALFGDRVKDSIVLTDIADIVLCLSDKRR